MWVAAAFVFSLLPEFFDVTTPELRTVEVSWMAVDDVDARCREDMEISPFQTVKGCTYYSLKNRKCTIITGKSTDTSTLGHELRHCFDGSFHGDPPPRKDR